MSDIDLPPLYAQVRGWLRNSSCFEIGHAKRGLARF
jgi:hypothetical protein